MTHVYEQPWKNRQPGSCPDTESDDGTIPVETENSSMSDTDSQPSDTGAGRVTVASSGSAPTTVTSSSSAPTTRQA